MSINVPYNPNMYRVNPMQNTAAASSTAAAGGFVSEVFGGSLPMVAMNYGKTIYNASRHPRIAKAAIKETETILKGLEEAGKLKDLADIEKAAVYGETYRNVNKAMRTGKSAAEAATLGAETASKTVGTVTAAGAKTAAEIAGATTSAGRAWAWTKGALKSGGFKGMAILSALFELPELYSAYSQGGVGEGLKQTLKSSVKVVGDSAGWALGAAGGAKAGAAIGAAIGSIIPGAGTAAGGAIGAAIGGIVGGIGGSWLGRKTAKAVTGKSFNEKMAEQPQNSQIASAPTYNPANMPNVNFNPFINNPAKIPYLPLYNPAMLHTNNIY